MAITRKYKVIHSKSDDYVVYRKFNYKHDRQIGIRGFLAVVFLSLGIFLLIPDFDDVLVFTAASRAISSIINISLQKSFVMAASIYKGTGLIFLILSIILGGNYIKSKLERKMIFAKKKLKKDL